MFSEFVRKIRISQKMGIEQFAEAAGVDVIDWSDIEANRLPPPTDIGALHRIAESLNIQEGTPDREEFFKLAVEAHGLDYNKRMSDEELVARLPLFFRTEEGKKPSREDLAKLVEILRS